MIGIYKIENKINGKIYIGQSTNINKRLTNHKSLLRGNKHYNNHLQSAFNKYGEDNFIFEIIDICGIDELDALERLYINKYECKHNEWGYNLEDGGHENKQLSEETKRKISKNHADFSGENNPNYGKKHSDETKAKIKNSLTGKKLSDETKAKISKRHKGKKLSEEHKEKISNSHKGKKHSEETRKKLSEYKKGKKLSKETRIKMAKSRTGKKHSEETKNKIRDANKGENSPCYRHDLPSETELLNEYETTKTSYKKLGDKYGCSATTIMRRIKKALKNED